jgi:hypothetical protein
MPRLFVSLVCAVAVIGNCQVRADDTSAAVGRQKATAEGHWSALRVPPPGRAESANFLVYGTAPEARLQALAAALEKQYAAAVKALQFEKDEKPWAGKMAVHVFADRTQQRSFIRQVEKRSPNDAEQGSHVVAGDAPHVAAAPGKGRDAPTADAEAGYQMAAALLAARAKVVPLPEWLVVGFGRATAAQAANAPPGVRKRVPRELARRFKAADAWNDALPAELRFAVGVGVADYLFYGNGVEKPAEFLQAFRPSDEQPTKTTADALAAVMLTPEQLETGYLRWLKGNN